MAVEVFDDDRRVGDHDAVVDEEWDRRPVATARRVPSGRLDELGRERQIAFVKGDERLPAVHREGVLMQDEARAGASSARKASSPSSSRPVPGLSGFREG